jgi:hypothetical protein
MAGTTAQHYPIHLPSPSRTLFTEWNAIALNAVAHLRAMSGLAPLDQNLIDLIHELDTRSEDFSRIWRLHDVRFLSTGRKLFDHPKVGALELNYEVLDIAGTCQRLVIYQAAPGSIDGDTVQLLAMLDSTTKRTSSESRH